MGSLAEEGMVSRRFPGAEKERSDMFKRGFVSMAVVLALSAGSTFADVITQWNFEGDVTTPSTGSGSASLVGGTTATFATGNPAGRGWNTTTYAAQGTGSGTRGVEFLVSTAGYQDITVSYDHRASGTASRWSELQYTLDGSTWNSFGDNGGLLSPHDTFYAQSFNLSSIAGANNNPDFGIRIVSIFAPVAFDQNASLPDFAANTAYQRANAQSGFDPGSGIGTGDYGPAGTWRFDNVTISGNLVPEPATLALLGFSGLFAIRRRR
ncbi:MAG: PEP-CTERM sorting domain-containing protein [Phycisphaerae bacterium]|nr:PEP-CTERM sorting domain-containing protein [Phycisphaerae bacterium]